MDCTQARQLLDLVPAGAPVRSPEEHDAAAHTEQCEQCRAVVERRRTNDAQLRAALHSVEVPDRLLERLLENVDERSGSAPQPAPNSAAPSRRKLIWSAIAGAVLAGCVLIAIVFWNGSQPGPTTLAFSEVQQQLRTLFADPSEQTWANLPPADASLDVGPLDGSLRRLKLIDSKGINLDGQPGEDAVAYRFRNARGTGIVVVIPAARLSVLPENAVPSPTSKQAFAWRSASGEEVYLCFVHQGRAEDLMNLMFPTA